MVSPSSKSPLATHQNSVEALGKIMKENVFSHVQSKDNFVYMRMESLRFRRGNKEREARTGKERKII